MLAGAPNSGKSSLFNALLGVERAIVTEVAGTTRDAVEAATTIDGYLCRFVDTAGLRDATDRVEMLGIEVARRYLDHADLVLFCVEAQRAVSEEEEFFLRSLPGEWVLVRTKGDLGWDDPAGPGAEEVVVSSRLGGGLDLLRDRIVARTFASPAETEHDIPLVTRRRHAEALQRALEEVDACLAALDQDVPPELAVTHLRGAADHLAELLGAITSDDVLGAIFSEFCVGK